MATAVDYGLGPHTFPRGWFVVAESAELDQGPRAVRFFGRDLALYRGESGNPVLLDAYCGHMGTHLAASDSAMIVRMASKLRATRSAALTTAGAITRKVKSMISRITMGPARSRRRLDHIRWWIPWAVSWLGLTRSQVSLITPRHLWINGRILYGSVGS